MIKVTRISIGPWDSLKALITVEVEDGIELNGIKHIIDAKGNDFIAGPSKQKKNGDWNDLIRLHQDAQDEIRKQICTHKDGYDANVGGTSAPPSEVPAEAAKQYDDDGSIPF